MCLWLHSPATVWINDCIAVRDLHSCVNCLCINHSHFGMSAWGNLKILSKKLVFVCIGVPAIACLYHNLITVSWQQEKMNISIEVYNNSSEFEECGEMHQKYAKTLKARHSNFLMDAISSQLVLFSTFFHL